jgi:3-oxoacyl-ACP reductase-like protein
MKYLVLIIASFAFLGCSQPAPGPTTTPDTPATSATPAASPSVASTPGAAAVSFGNLKDGDTVKSPVKVVMVVEGMEVKPAGEDVPNSGHHHIIIDGEPVPKGQPVPADDTHIHFGKGQTETELTLEPGEHTLTLQFANYAHQSYGPDLSNTIKVTVE